MAFWQSRVWTAATHSIYPVSNRGEDPAFLPWWREAWLLFRRRRRFDVVVTMGAREALAYGLLCVATGAASKQVFTEVFIDEPRPESLLWRLKTAAFRLVARRAIGVLTNSSLEVETNAERFGLPRGRIRFVPMHGTIPEVEPSGRDEGYVLAAGRTLRDYETLLKAAPLIGRRIVVVCGDGDLVDARVPANVEILREIPRDIYLEKLRRCTLVALPLRRTGRSTGQVVALEAMAFGKPVVTTRAPGTNDIIRDRENGRLVPAGDPVALADAVNELLERDDIARAMATRARADLMDLYTFDRHAEAKLRAIADLWQTRRTR